MLIIIVTKRSTHFHVTSQKSWISWISALKFIENLEFFLKNNTISNQLPLPFIKNSNIALYHSMPNRQCTMYGMRWLQKYPLLMCYDRQNESIWKLCFFKSKLFKSFNPTTITNYTNAKIHKNTYFMKTKSTFIYTVATNLILICFWICLVL